MLLSSVLCPLFSPLSVHAQRQIIRRGGSGNANPAGLQANEYTTNASGTDITAQGKLTQKKLATHQAGTEATNANFAGTVKISLTNDAVPLTIRGTATQSSNLWEVTDYTGAVIAYLTSSGRLLLPNGSASVPAIGSLNDDDGSGTGLYRSAANQWRFSANNNDVAQWDVNGVSNRLALGVAGKITAPGGIDIPGFNAASNLVYVCTNATTGQGEWRRPATTIAAAPFPSLGFSLQTDGTNSTWVGPDTGWQLIVREEFLGDVVTLNTISCFREPWYFTATGTSPPAQPAPYEDGLLGIYPFWSTNSAVGRYGYIGGQSTQQGVLACTNLELACFSRIRIGLTNVAGDLSCLLGGVGNVASGTADPTDGIFFRTSTNADCRVELVTTRASSRTVTVTLGSVGQYAWTNVAWVLDGTGTNVTCYMGGWSTNMVPVATNSANIPNSVLVNPFVQGRRIASSSGTANRTNCYDYYFLYARRR